MKKSMSSCNELEIGKEALRQTELQLQGLENLANNADSRAMAFAASATATFAFWITIASKLPVPICAFLGAAFALISAAIAIYSASPRLFHVLGHTWAQWKGHVEDNDEIKDVLITQAEENDNRIIDNRASLKRRSFWLSVSITILVYSQVFIISGQIWPTIKELYDAIAP